MDLGKSRRDLWIAMLLVAVVLILYLPGIDWGLPRADAPGNISSWGSDEIGPIGPLKQLAGWLGAIKAAPQDPADPQYPLFHYIVVALFDVSYLIWLGLTGRWCTPKGYPYGFRDPVAA